MSPGLISVISAKSEEFTCLFLTFMEKYLFRSGWSSGISSPSGKILIPVRMVLGNFQPERKEPYHAILVDLHEPSVFCGEYQRWRVAEIYKAEMAVGAYLAVQHRRDFARIVLRIPSIGDARQPTVKAMRWRAPAVRPALSSRYFWRHPALFFTSSRVIRVAARTAAGFISGTGRFNSPGRI